MFTLLVVFHSAIGHEEIAHIVGRIQREMQGELVHWSALTNLIIVNVPDPTSFTTIQNFKQVEWVEFDQEAVIKHY
jgi:hypothetical protein